ncbi:glucosyltransferase MdoH [Alkalidesulfovibrio alkalitolerans DSM 16529]|jgi:membrane glycosyltransferase|uniref:Glucans biosynthesis glucosyltransferase H n=1 Tax=Alkalidesulfovibrio alkalitolerans DSM 16529 TaxID=1121439 RepID=S7UGI5_9BACT|nr:glucans biosynthesis glucosyltransferase MdoH [Alkalidesulfovibrio alkalitolerans]EPR32939.1 glucosyltransferase MdoH [Alkalidesulfovibrio alkalitolerans DSM 16529]
MFETRTPGAPGRMPKEIRTALDEAGRRLSAYLRRFPLSETRRLELALGVLRDLDPQPGETAETLTGRAVAAVQEELGRSETLDVPTPCPPLVRRHMAPEEMHRRPWSRPPVKPSAQGFLTERQTREYLNEPWMKRASRRRIVLIVLVLLPTILAALNMGAVLPHKGSTALELAIVAVFSILFAWISIGFWTAMAGFWTLFRRFDRFVITTTKEREGDVSEPRKAMTAILFPVCNEEFERTAAGIRATYLSLERAGALTGFHFFILSDSKDPDRFVQEEAIWRRLCEELGAQGRIFYRRRRVNLKRKSGNIADFCRRFGAGYEYMAVMDADSVMSGSILVRMVQIMERRRHVGILQTAPRTAGRETLIARAQQFANRLYGPMFAAGLHFWQLGDAQYWGHNALIRVKPFMKHCGLPRLPGKPPLGGDIMSHDFVEAALMRRASYGVWLAFDLEGTWEEVPPTLLAELKRDRRWCQGNMQHMRLLLTRGLLPAHRFLFLNGFMSYFSAFLWFAFLVLSTAEAVLEALAVPVYFPQDRVLFPEWPVWEPMWALVVLAMTFVLLFLPKVASWFLVVTKGGARRFGGVLSLSLGIVADVVLSTLLAPVRMMFHTKFVANTLIGRASGWPSQDRSDSGTPFSEALRFHGLDTCLAAVWGLLLWHVNPAFFWWTCPIIFSLLLSAPLSSLTSSAQLGRAARRMGIFVTPEEVEPPRELAETASGEEHLKAPAEGLADPLGFGFARAVVDPLTNAVHLRLARGERSLASSVALERRALLERLLQKGPSALSARDKNILLADPGLMREAHLRAWTLPPSFLAERFGARL